MERGGHIKYFKNLAIKLLGGKCAKCGDENIDHLTVLELNDTVYCAYCYPVVRRQVADDKRNEELKAIHTAMAKAKGWNV